MLVVPSFGTKLNIDWPTLNQCLKKYLKMFFEKMSQKVIQITFLNR